MDTLFPYVPLLIERYDFLVNELDTSEKRECLVRLPLYYSVLHSLVLCVYRVLRHIPIC